MRLRLRLQLRTSLDPVLPCTLARNSGWSTNTRCTPARWREASASAGSFPPPVICPRRRRTLAVLVKEAHVLAQHAHHHARVPRAGVLMAGGVGGGGKRLGVSAARLQAADERARLVVARRHAHHVVAARGELDGQRAHLRRAGAWADTRAVVVGARPPPAGPPAGARAPRAAPGRADAAPLARAHARGAPPRAAGL